MKEQQKEAKNIISLTAEVRSSEKNKKKRKKVKKSI